MIASSNQIGPSSVTTRAHAFARVVRTAFRDGTGMPYANYVAGGDALDFRSDLGTLNLSAAPAVMVETGNMRNKKDAALLSSKAFRQAEAVAFADASRPSSADPLDGLQGVAVRQAPRPVGEPPLVGLICSICPGSASHGTLSCSTSIVISSPASISAVTISPSPWFQLVGGVVLKTTSVST